MAYIMQVDPETFNVKKSRLPKYCNVTIFIISDKS